jgi:MOSC domain-containing protein YiiM
MKNSESNSAAAHCSPLTARVVAVSVSEEKGVKKTPVSEVILKKGQGVVGDAHAGAGIRQVSLLAEESIEKMRRKNLPVGPGDFAENITTSGLDLPSLPIGTCLRLGKTTLLKITQIGKECHSRCRIFYSAGDCVMPREGVFAVVLRGGKLQPGDEIRPIARTIASGLPSPTQSLPQESVR